ncbi:MAG: hypothetical protein ABFS35_00415 [Bacteroidota bacterium]
MNQMKQLSLIFLLSLSLFGCQDKITREITYMANVPVYLSNEEFKTAIKKTNNEELNNPGKIYIKDQYLFVNEINKGIHIYNNFNPSEPKYVCFINIPGNVDMAIKSDLLYADSYIDLIVIDISDINNPVEVDRYPNAFPNIYPEYDYNYPIAPLDAKKGIVVDWKIEEITVEKEEEYQYYGGGFWEKDMALASSTNGGGTGNIGVAGSMARFAIKGNALYAINNGYELKTFDIATHEIKKVDSISTFWNIETLFVYEDKLFIGSNNGMFIYDVLDSKHPVYISQYDHITSCDPVVVNGDYAFVTLRSGTNCRNNINELNVVSLADIQNPILVKAYNMYNPHGLGIDENVLFICDGSAGLKVFDATDVYSIDQNMIIQFPNIQTFDVIPLNDILIMTGSEGIYQYDYSDIQNINEISHITINHPLD